MFGIPFIVNFFACIWYDAGTNQYTLHNDEFSSHMNRISGNSNNHALPFRSEYLQLICHWTFWLPIKCTWYAVWTVSILNRAKIMQSIPPTHDITPHQYSVRVRLSLHCSLKRIWVFFFSGCITIIEYLYIVSLLPFVCVIIFGSSQVNDVWGREKKQERIVFFRLSTLWSSLEWAMSGSTSPDWHSIKKIRTWKSLIREITEKARKFIFGKRRHSQESVTILTSINEFYHHNLGLC